MTLTCSPESDRYLVEPDAKEVGRYEAKQV